GTIFGDGNQTRDFVYVDDVVDAFARAASKGSGLLMNIGTGNETSVNELYDTMAAAAGATTRPTYAAARAGELARSSLDPTRAGRHLGHLELMAKGVGGAAEVDHRGDAGAADGHVGDPVAPGPTEGV